MPEDPPSPPLDGRDPRTLRLFDLGPHEAILVRCECGRMSEYGPGLLQRLHRIPSDTLIYDLQSLRHPISSATAGSGASALEQRTELPFATRLPLPL